MYCSISVYCIKHLPIIDFRPYKIGANIPEGMAIPEDAEADVYEMSFIYEKDGVQKVFTEDNLPDASWTFIDSESKLIKKGYEPPIHDFSLESDEYGDITEDMLADESLTIDAAMNFFENNRKLLIILITKDGQESISNFKSVYF